MPMLTYMSMRKAEFPEWFVYLAIAFCVCCLIAILIIGIKGIKDK